MGLKDLLTIDHIFNHVDVDSKKRLLELISEKAIALNPQLQEADIFDALIARERLGSTGIGYGVGIPHCRLAQLDQAMGLLLILQKSIKFDAIDQQPVDIIFALLVPQAATEEHLHILANVAQVLDNASLREQLRTTSDSQQIFNLITTHHG